MSKITKEMDELEKEKQKFAYLAKFHELKIQRIKALQNLEQVENEIEKISKHIEKFEGAYQLLKPNMEG